MTGTDLAGLAGYAFAFSLALSRCAGTVALLPGLSEVGVPPVLRAGIAGALALLLTPAIAPLAPASPSDPPGFAAALGAELVCGLWLGFLARIMALALPIAGQIAAGLLGLSNIVQADPELGPQTSVLSVGLGIAGAVLVLSTGLYALPVSALAGSYALFPPGAGLPGGAGADAVARAVAASFGLAVRLAAPAILLGTLWTLGSGFAGRIAPRVQVYFLALPAQIFLGLGLLAAVATTLLGTWQEALRAAWTGLPGLR